MTDRQSPDALLTLVDRSATAEGKTLGQIMYEAMQREFGLRPWKPSGNSVTCGKYERAATRFALRIANAILDAEEGRGH